MTAAALMAGCGGEAEEETGATAVPADPGATTAPVTPAVTPAEPAGAAGGDAALIQQGQQVFTGAGNCQACHMPNGQGGPLAPNLTDAEWIWFEGTPDVDQMVTLIKTGITAPKEHPAPMPAMGGGTLSDEQLRAVSLYVLSLS